MNHLRRYVYPNMTEWDEYFRLWIKICVLQPHKHKIERYNAVEISDAYERYCSKRYCTEKQE